MYTELVIILSQFSIHYISLHMQKRKIAHFNFMCLYIAANLNVLYMQMCI